MEPLEHQDRDETQDMKPQREMPKYQSYKIVHALKIKEIKEPLPSGDCMFLPEDEGFDWVFLPKDYMRKHQPQVGGYYVVYDDGYKSWSPAKAFEEGYTLI